MHSYPSKKIEKDDYIDCEAFADLLQKIYENPNDNFQMDRDQITIIPAFSFSELLKGLKRVKKEAVQIRLVLLWK